MARASGLQVAEDDTFQEREWHIVRLGWVLMTLFVLAGLVGLLGTGPLSWRTSASETDAVSVRHQRVTHHEADDMLTVQLGEQAVDAGKGIATVRLTGSWVSGVDLQSITPQPSAQRLLPDGVELEFEVAEPGQQATGPRQLEVVMAFRAQSYGVLSGTLVGGGEAATFRQLVLP